MLIKTEGLETCTNRERTWNEPYEIWVNPRFVTSALPERRAITMLGEEGVIQLTKDGFERFCKTYEQVDE